MVQLSSSDRWQLPVRWKDKQGSRTSRIGLISARFGWRDRISLSCSSSERAVIFSTVLWISLASPDIELGLTRDCNVFNGIVGSLSVSQIWLPSQVKATTSDGSRNGSSRSINVSAASETKNKSLTFKPSLQSVKLQFPRFTRCQALIE